MSTRHFLAIATIAAEYVSTQKIDHVGLEDVKFADVDCAGNPVQTACLECMNTLVESWPGRTWKESCDQQLGPSLIVL